MDLSVWLERVRLELSDARLPAAYRERLIEELREHIKDLQCERSRTMSTELMKTETIDARLGSPEQIASAAANVARRLSFARKHPVATFIVLPVPALVLLWIAYAAAIVGMLGTFKSFASYAWSAPVASGLIHGMAYVPPVLLTLALGWIAMRRRCAIGWWLGSAALVALFAGLLMVSFRMPTTPGTGLFQVGFGFPPSLANWPQAAIPMILATLVTLYMVRKNHHDALRQDHQTA